MQTKWYIFDRNAGQWGYAFCYRDDSAEHGARWRSKCEPEAGWDTYSEAAAVLRGLMASDLWAGDSTTAGWVVVSGLVPQQQQPDPAHEPESELYICYPPAACITYRTKQEVLELAERSGWGAVILVPKSAVITLTKTTTWTPKD